MPARTSILSTPAASLSANTQDEEEEKTIRQSGRIASIQKTQGKKKTERMAQEILAKKLRILTESTDKKEEARNRIMNLFEGPVPAQAMQAMEDLLQAMNIDGKQNIEGKQATKPASKGGARKAK